MNKFSVIMTFVAGVIIGAVPSWYFTKKKHEEINRRDIESVRESLGFMREKYASEEKGTQSEEKIESRKESVKEYVDIIKNAGYKKDAKEEERPKFKEPYVITPDDFYEDDEYERLSFVLFRDDILVDDDYRVVHDINDVVGNDSLNHFGEYEDDVVYVRNDKYKTIYEICKDERSYEEFLETNPHKREV